MHAVVVNSVEKFQASQLHTWRLSHDYILAVDLGQFNSLFPDGEIKHGTVAE